MNLSQVSIILVFILSLVTLEKKALRNHSDYRPFYTEMTTEQCRKYISDMNIKKELMQLRAKVLKTTTTGAPSTTGRGQNMYKYKW